MQNNQLQRWVSDLDANELVLQPMDQRREDKENRWYNHFHCRHRNSHKLLICVGDSWTKGAGMEVHGDQFRLKHIFGKLVSDRLESDFLNMGGGGHSNSWCMTQMELLLDRINRSDYQKGYLVFTFTENGRDVKTYSHRRFDYISAYGHLAHDLSLYDRVLDDIEQEWIDRLVIFRKNLHPRFQVICGQNFIWNERIVRETEKIDGIHWIKNNWIEHLAMHLGKSAPARTRIVGLHHIETINTILNLTDLSAWKEWFLKHAEDVRSVTVWLAETHEFFDKHDIAHPNAAGHSIWADAVYKSCVSSNRQ
jgi:lysophospholipase L1-like esterase